MADLNKILEQFMGSGAAGGFAGGLAGGLTSSMLTSKKGRKLGKSALKMGGMAAVGAMAYGAYKKYSSSKTGTTQALPPQNDAANLQMPPQESSFLPAAGDQQGTENLGLTLVRAMIAAARSDGTLDAQESQAIFQRINSLPLGQEEKSLLIEEMGRPVNMDTLVNSATTIEIASEIYLASLLAIDVDTAAEESYLAMLAARLKLPAELVAELHKQVQMQAVAS